MPRETSAALRMCIVNFRTDIGDVRALAEISVELGREVDAGLRSRVPVPRRPARHE